MPLGRSRWLGAPAKSLFPAPQTHSVATVRPALSTLLGTAMRVALKAPAQLGLLATLPRLFANGAAVSTQTTTILISRSVRLTRATHRRRPNPATSFRSRSTIFRDRDRQPL